jgi:predicted permease
LNGLAFDLWVPIGAHAQLLGPSRWLETRGWHSLHTLARLAPGASVESAGTELANIARQLDAALPERRGVSFVALPITASPHGIQSELGRPLLLLLGVAALLLFIVCANLSNLLLVRASARQREMSIRQALGAGTWRIVRQALAEGLVLSAAGTLLACLVTLWTANLLRQFIPDAAVPISLTADLSARVLGLGILVATSTVLLASVAPALWSARARVLDVLRASSRVAAITPRAEFFRRLLVIGQVALALITLAAAALAAKSFYVAKRTHPGFEPRGVLLAGLKFDTSGYSRQQALAFLDRLEPRLGALPGVESAALAEHVPLGLGRGSWEEVVPAGYVPAASEETRVYRNFISPGYFSLMRIPLLAGRDFTDADRGGAPWAAIVNESFARRYYGVDPEQAVGRTFAIWGGNRVLTIVGVVRDIKVYRLGESASPYYYAPVRQFLQNDTGLAIQLRTAMDPLALLPVLRELMRELDPNLVIFEALTLEDYVSAARFAQKAAATLLAVLSAMALALTSLGLYGVLAFAVAQRTPEIGVRLALGAQHGDIARLILGRGATLIAIGVVLGLAGSIAVARGLAALLYGVSRFEPVLLAAATMLVIVSAFAACLVPARRATKVDPMAALRAE